MTNKLLYSLLSACALSMAVFQVNAAVITDGTVIGIDFSNIQGTLPVYNLFTASGNIPANSVIDLGGTPIDGISVTLSGSAPVGFGSAGVDGFGPSAPSFPGQVQEDFVFHTGGNVITISIAGLDPTFTYDWLSTNAVGPDFGTRNNRIDVVTLSGLVGGDQAIGTLRNAATETSFVGLQLTGGTLTATISETIAGNPIIGGIQLTAHAPPVPEPGTWALFGIILAIGLGWRRSYGTSRT